MRTVAGDGEARVPALSHQQCCACFPLDSAVQLVVLQQLGRFDPIATGPWLRDRLVRLGERLDAAAAGGGAGAPPLVSPHHLGGGRGRAPPESRL